MSIKNNTTDLQAILEAVNNLPEEVAPEITVDMHGLVTATAGSKSTTHQLSSDDSSGLVSENIIEGKYIFGVLGTAEKANTAMEDGLVTRSLTTYYNNRVRTIGSSAFMKATNLKSVEFSNCSSIGPYAFNGCSNLIYISFPAVQTIGASAFYSCMKLSYIYFPLCSSIGSYAFGYCQNLYSIYLSACTNIGNNAFCWCHNLVNASLPFVSTIGSSAFQGCSYYLKSLSLPRVTTINNGAFSNCVNLSSLTLGNSTVCSLANSKAFYMTPYTGYTVSYTGTPYIYVPSSLVSSYKAATNWTYFSSYIKAIGT